MVEAAREQLEAKKAAEEKAAAEKAAAEKAAAEKEAEARKAKAAEKVKAVSMRKARSEGERERPPCQTCVKRGMANRCEWRAGSSKPKSCIPCAASKAKCVHGEDEEFTPRPRKKSAKSGEATPAEPGPSRTDKGKGRAEAVRPPAEKPEVVMSMVEVQMQML